MSALLFCFIQRRVVWCSEFGWHWMVGISVWCYCVSRPTKSNITQMNGPAVLSIMSFVDEFKWCNCSTATVPDLKGYSYIRVCMKNKRRHRNSQIYIHIYILSICSACNSNWNWKFIPFSEQYWYAAEFTIETSNTEKMHWNYYVLPSSDFITNSNDAIKMQLL